MKLETIRFNNITIRNNKDLTIYTINRDKEIKEPEVFTYFQSWNDNLKRSESIEVININSKIFFTEKYTNEMFLDKDYDWNSKIFVFDDTPWNSLVNKFKSLGISLSGGSTVKRHLLSPIHMRLSRFLLILEGHEKSYIRTIDSYKLNTIVHSKNSIKNFSKNKSIWKLRNIFKKVEGYNNEWDLRLFLIFKTHPEKLESNEPDISNFTNKGGYIFDAEHVEKYFNKFPVDKRDCYNPKIMPDFYKNLEKYDTQHHYKNNEDDDDDVYVE